MSPHPRTPSPRWQARLADERRLSPKTCEAYLRDVAQFLSFLGVTPGMGIGPRLKALEAGDIRALWPKGVKTGSEAAV